MNYEYAMIVAAKAMANLGPRDEYAFDNLMELSYCVSIYYGTNKQEAIDRVMLVMALHYSNLFN